ncbi:MAG: carbohydrate ABC transporter permease, partial [Clostridiaceae bacterium]|nr:carbohydrate ABC transporter permease [Clostridiaceae bacterium]
MTEGRRYGLKRERKEYSIYGFNYVDVIIYIFMGLLALTTVYPFIFVIANSMSEPLEVAANNVWFFPKGFSLKSYERVLSSKAIFRAFGNSVFFTGLITFLNVLNSLCAGFALSKKGLMGRKYIVLYLMIPMFFNAGLIPTFIMINNYNMLNTLWAIILPSIVGIWNI